MSSSTAILFLGLPASGKSTALDAVSDLGIPTFEMSDVAAWKFEQVEGRSPEGTDLREFGTRQRNLNYQGVFGEYAAEYMAEEFGSPDFFAVAGVRSPGEIIAMQREAETYNVLIEAPRGSRLKRIQDRQRDGEEGFTMEDLTARDDEEIEWGAQECEMYADAAVVNWNYTEAEFRADVQATVSPLLAVAGQPE